ncbi:unnamed protein product [Victoria cruziana]
MVRPPASVQAAKPSFLPPLICIWFSKKRWCRSRVTVFRLRVTPDWAVKAVAMSKGWLGRSALCACVTTGVTPAAVTPCQVWGRLRVVGGGGFAVRADHGGDAVGTGEVAVEIVEGAVLGVDDDDVLDLALQRIGVAGVAEAAGGQGEAGDGKGGGQWARVDQGNAPAGASMVAPRPILAGSARSSLDHCSRMRISCFLPALLLALPALLAAAPPESPYVAPFERHPDAAALSRLGRVLFFEPGLSASGRQSCASCHDPAHGYGPPDGLAVRLGGAGLDKPGQRAVPSLRYRQTTPPFSEHYFDDDGNDSEDQGPSGGYAWDGRAGNGQRQPGRGGAAAGGLARRGAVQEHFRPARVRAARAGLAGPALGAGGQQVRRGAARAGGADAGRAARPGAVQQRLAHRLRGLPYQRAAPGRVPAVHRPRPAGAGRAAQSEDPRQCRSGLA